MAAPSKKEISQAIPTDGLEVKTIELKRPEDEQEKALRLHKEKVSFYVKEVGALGLAASVVIAIVICSFVILAVSTSPAAGEWARSALMLALGGAAGFAFGTKK
jgi:hypothetical protein